MKRHASLNRIYRLIWSHVHQAWVIVSEVARGKGGKARRKMLATALMLTTTHLAQAGPTAGQVTLGTGSISHTGTTTTVTQTSQNLSLSWQSFNTNSQETVNFLQPSASAVAVNRIHDTNPTQFFGHLNANGQVYLINPNGVLFGTGSQINVGGLVASTLDLSDDAAIGSASRNFSGRGAGSIINQGAIHAANGGYVAFIGNTVKNQGSITAPMGTIALGAGSDITLAFAGNSLLKMQVNQNTLDNLAENGGLIRAEGGAVLLSAGAKDAVLASVINNTGVIEAHSVHNVNGSIVLDGGNLGTVSNAGTLDASGKDSGETGGTVKVLGETISLTASSSIDVSGDAGGGIALIGGNFYGTGPEQNAQNTAMASGSSIKADAISKGNGGQVALWSDHYTHFNGSISARGGSTTGNGGQIETSGKTLKIGSDAFASTQAPHGKAGSWLLDPQDFTIAPSGGDVKGSQITAALLNTDVTIITGSGVSCTGVSCGSGISGAGDINVNDDVIVDWTSNTTLTLSAYRDININNTIIDASGSGNINLRADNTATGIGTVNINGGSLLFANNGNINVYYNPTDYAHPTDYSGWMFIAGGGSGQLNSYMAINLNVSIQNKTYDGMTAATIGSISTLQAPSDATVDLSGATASFNSKNVGTNKSTTVNGVTLTGANASSYYLNGLTSQTANISKANLTVTGVSASNKTYDGTTAASLSGTATVSAFGSDVVSVSGGAGTFASKNVGTGIAVTASGYTLGGADASNYNIVQPTGLSANISKANLTVSGVSAGNKTYDGSTAATLSGTATVSVFGSDVVSVTGTGSATFADKNAGNGKAVTVSGYSLSGADAGNYNIVQPAGLTANISKANLALNGLSASNKVYDATTVATLSGTASVSALGSDVVTLSGTGTGAFADKNVGTNKAVTVSGYTLGGADAGNYTLVAPSSLTATISKADLAVSGVSASNKTYDGSTAATLSGTATVSALGSDVVSVTGSGTGTFASKNAGTGIAVTATGYTLSGADAGNYNIVQPTGLSANIGKANLAVTGVSANNKTYDGTTAATLNGTATVSAIGSDVVSVAGTGSATFADKNAGNGKAVTVSGYTLGGADSGNYNVVQPVGLSANIGKADLAITGLSASNKVYDGTTAATIGGTASVSAIGSDVVSVTGTGTGTFADKNAGNNKAVTVSGYTLGGADAGNYNLAQPTGLTANISKADLTVSGLTADNKVYDGTTAATLSGTATVSAIGSDVVSVSGGTGTFASKNVGTGIAVTVTGYTLTGADAGNYNAVALPGGLSANISKADLAVSGVSANNKTYDGTTAATLNGTATVSTIGSDVVSVTGTGSATFADKNAGNGKAVTVSGYTLGGADAGNYNVVQPVGLSANIGKADLAITGLSASNKVYDGTTAAAIGGTASISAIGSDVVSVTGTGTGTFADKNAGNNKAVTVSGYTLSGADAGNYNLAQPAGLTANISKADLAVSGLTADNKVYDGTTAATLSGTATISPIGSDVVSVSGGTGSFASKNVGTGIAVTVTGYTLSGADAGNYNAVGLPGALTADISKANLAVSGVSANNKTYDGTTAATLNGTATVSAFGSDVVSVTGTGSGTFADKNAGNGKAVTVSGYSLSGADAGNYNIVQPASLSANIDKAALAITGLSASDKVYDGTTAATISGIASVSAIGSDVVTLGGAGAVAFADKNAGTNKAMTVSGYTLGGADAGNYNLVASPSLTATISKANLAVSGLSANNKTYDGTTAATLSGTAKVSAIGSDAVSVTGAGIGTFVDKNAGTNKAVTVSGYSLNGADAQNYNIVLPGGLSASIGKADLVISGVSANNKTYDGTTAATLSGTATVSAFGNDAVSVTGAGRGVFADKNAGNGKAVTATGYTLSGADAGNYNIVLPTGLSADIGKADLVITGLSANNKVYDGTTAATINGAASVSAFGSDVVSVTGTGTGVFANKNVGNNKTVTVSGYSLSGADAGNYNLAQPTGLTANITPASITVSGITANDKTFDGTTAATVSTASATLAGRIGSDVVTISATGRFADPSVGTGKTVNLSSTYGGADAGNYTFVDQATAIASINAQTTSSQPIQSAVTQVQSAVLAPQAASQPGTLSLSQTLTVEKVGVGDAQKKDTKETGRNQMINTVAGFGSTGPTLRIQNFGIQLPDNTITVAE